MAWLEKLVSGLLRHGVLKIPKVASIEFTGPDGVKRQYKSLEEAPPEVRSQVESVLAGRAPDAGGLLGLEDLPPELRAQAQQLRVSGGGAVFVDKTSGQTHVYKSLDDAPPEVRARVEQMMSGAEPGAVVRKASIKITGSPELGSPEAPADETPAPALRAAGPKSLAPLVIKRGGGLWTILGACGAALGSFWPVLILPAVVVAAILLFGRHATLFDRERNVVATWWEFIWRFSRRTIPLERFHAVGLDRRRRAFRVQLDGMSEQLVVDTLSSHLEARRRADQVAGYLGMQVNDRSVGSAATN